VGMFLLGKNTYESAHELETALRLLWIEFRNRRWVVDNEFQFGDEVGHEPCIWPQRLHKSIAPDRQLDARSYPRNCCDLFIGLNNCFSTGVVTGHAFRFLLKLICDQRCADSQLVQRLRW